MDSQMNLSHLSEEECQQILAVIQRDFNLRQQEKDRLEELKAEIKQEKLRSDILSKGHTFNENCCVRCFSQFFIFFNPKVQCMSCKYNVCKKCSMYDNRQKEYMCSMCKKQEELEALSNSWFYSNVAERFDRFGSADVVRSMYKKKTESDVDSDSGYHPPRTPGFEPNGKNRMPSVIGSSLEKPSTTGTDRQKSVLAHLRQRLDVIEKSVKKLHFKENKSEQQKQFYDNSVKQNIDNVQALLMSVARQLASNLNSADSDDNCIEPVNCEEKETICKRLLQNALHQLYSSPSSMASVNNGDPFALIDPVVLTLDAYTKRLSEAIINKINEELHQSERQIENEAEEEEEEEVVIKIMHGALPQLSDCELLTTDSLSDVDIRDRISLWRQKSLDTNLSRSESLSLTSLNRSQSEMEIPSCFIESKVLTEKLATLNQSEISHAVNQSSVVTQMNPAALNQSDLDTCLASNLSQADADTSTSETLNQSNSETLEAGPSCAEQLEDNSVPNAKALNKKFDSAEYEVTTDCILAFAMRKKEMPVLPSFDSEEGVATQKSSDSDLDLTRGHEENKLCGPWTLGIHQRIPMTPHGSFRRKQLSDRSQNDSPLIFLPKHLQIEEPFIGDISASELSDTDSLSVTDGGNEADEDEVKRKGSCTQTNKDTPARHRTRSFGQLADSRRKPKSSVDGFAQTDGDTSDERISTESEMLNAALGKNSACDKDLLRDSCMHAEEESTKTDEGSQTDCPTDSSSFDLPDSGQVVEPRFTETPQNVVVSCGQSFKCRATLNGRKPIDVFWFRDMFRLDYDERCTVAHKGRVYSLEVVESTPADDGHYICIAVNEHGRCSHRFTVSVVENSQKAEANRAFKVLATAKREKSDPTSQHQPKARSQIAADAMPKTAAAAAAQPPEIIPWNAVSSSAGMQRSSNLSCAVMSATESPCEVSLDDASPVCRQKLLELVPAPVAQGKLTTPTHDRTLASAAENAKKIPAQNQPAAQVPQKEASLHLDQFSPAKIYQSEATTENRLLQTVCKDANAGDGKVELTLSFPDFDRLYKSGIMTPNQLKSGRFTPEEVRLIQEELSSKPQKTEVGPQTDNQQQDDEKLATFDFSYKDQGLKAQLYGRDYVIRNSGELPAVQHAMKTKPGHQLFATSSVSSSSPQNSDNEIEIRRTAKSGGLRKYVYHPESSAGRDHPESRTLSHHLQSSSTPKGHSTSSVAALHQMEPPFASSTVAKSTKHMPYGAADKADRKMPKEGGSVTKTVTESEELSLPSVRSLRLLFSSSPASGDETTFTRNYSLTARDIQNSVVAQQHLAKKTRKPLLSLVSEPSSEDRRMHSEPRSSSREEN